MDWWPSQHWRWLPLRPFGRDVIAVIIAVIVFLGLLAWNWG